MTDNLPVYQTRETVQVKELTVSYKFSPQGIGKLVDAVTKARPKFDAIRKNAENPYYSDPKTKKARKYADLNEIIAATADALAEQGIHTFQFPNVVDRLVSLTTVVTHVSGEWVEATIENCPAEQKTEKGTRHDAQTIGIAITYLRRYTQQCIYNLGSEDDDGNGITQPPSKPSAPATLASYQSKAPAAVARPENVQSNLPNAVVQVDPANPRQDAEGCPVSDEDLPKELKPEALPTAEQRKSYGAKLREFKQDSRALKAWVEAQAGTEFNKITNAQFSGIFVKLNKANTDGGLEGVTKLIGEKNG